MRFVFIFWLAVLLAAAMADAPPETPRKIPLKDGGATKLGALTKDDPKDKVHKKSHCQVYEVELEAGREYQIDLSSTKIDPFLRLEDAGSKALAMDDDSGEKLNARIRHRPAVGGTRRIVVLCMAGRTGIFMLTVRRLGAAVAKGHAAAAEDLFKAMDMEKQLQASLGAALETQLKANPKMEPFKGVARKFLAKHLSYSALRDDLVKIYTEEFTEAELKELAAFYRTPVGKKLAEKAPRLTGKAAELGRTRAAENVAELKQMIEEELKKKK